MRPASILDRSRMSLISDSRWRPEEWMSFRYSSCLSFTSPNICSLSTSEKPMIAFSGVRSSCDMLARNSDLCLLAISSCRLFWRNSSVRSSTLRSRPTYDACRSAAILLNWSARPSSSSPVCTSIRCSSSPRPMRAAPASSARSGRTRARARKKLATIESNRPAATTSPMRHRVAYSGASTSARGDSTNTVQFRVGMAA